MKQALILKLNITVKDEKLTTPLKNSFHGAENIKNGNFVSPKINF